MKLQSEFYVLELAQLLYGINLQMLEISKQLNRIRLHSQVASRLMPWRSRVIWMTAATNVDILMQSVQGLSELHEKIMQAQGFDDDMFPVTLEQLFQKEATK